MPVRPRAGEASTAGRPTRKAGVPEQQDGAAAGLAGCDGRDCPSCSRDRRPVSPPRPSRSEPTRMSAQPVDRHPRSSALYVCAHTHARARTCTHVCTHTGHALWFTCVTGGRFSNCGGKRADASLSTPGTPLLSAAGRPPTGSSAHCISLHRGRLPANPLVQEGQRQPHPADQPAAPQAPGALPCDSCGWDAEAVCFAGRARR